MKIKTITNIIFFVLLCTSFLSPFCAISESLFSSKLPIAWAVNENGSFSITSTNLTIQNFYPQIDGQAIHPISYKVDKSSNGGSITYTLDNAKSIVIQLSSDTAGLTLSSTLKGFTTAPEYFCPAAAGQIKGANRLFKQGIGFGGPSAIMPIPKTSERVDINGMHEHVWSYDSYLAGGVIAPGNSTIAMAAYDHKRFLQRTTYYNKQTRFGLVDRWEATNYELIDIGFSTENVAANGKDIVFPVLNVYGGDDPFSVFKKIASDLASANNIKLNQAPAYHWCSWYDTEKEFDEKLLTEMLTGLQNIKPKIPIQTIQIDDGYFTHYGDWLHFDSTKFPSGFENNVKKIQKLGYRAGVWIGPFMVHERSELFKKHPDWLLHHLDGSLVIEWENEKEGNTYVLDASNPEAFEYLRSVFKKLRAMGFTYYKTDFMDWGLKNSTKFKRFTPGKTSAQYFDDVLKMIRQEIGPESFWLGCIMPFPPAVGYVDAIRNSNDVGKKWASSSHGNMIEESIHSQYTNNILWQTDPDVIYLNSFKTELTQTECTTLALFDGMLGGVINTSDRFHNMSAENLKMWRFIQPAKTHSSAQIPLWDKSSEIKILVRNHEQGRGAILFTNDKDIASSATFQLTKLLNKAQKHIYVWQPGKSNYEGLKTELKISLQPHESILYYFSDDQKAPAKDLGMYGIKVKGL